MASDEKGEEKGMVGNGAKSESAVAPYLERMMDKDKTWMSGNVQNGFQKTYLSDIAVSLGRPWKQTSGLKCWFHHRLNVPTKTSIAYIS